MWWFLHGPSSRFRRNVTDEYAAAAIEAYGTASYALETRGQLSAGEKVLIMGAGGAVGAAAVEIALHLDAEVIAHTSDPSHWDKLPVQIRSSASVAPRRTRSKDTKPWNWPG